MNWYTEKTIETLRRLDKIWFNLDIDDKFHQQLIEAANANDKEKFAVLLFGFEQHNKNRVEEYIDRLRSFTSRWPLFKKQQISERINQLQESGMDRLKAIQVACDELK